MKIRVKMTGPVVEWDAIEFDILGRYAPAIKAIEGGKCDSEIREIVRSSGVCFGDVENQISMIWNALTQCNPKSFYRPISTFSHTTQLAASLPTGGELVTRGNHRLVIEWPEA